MSFFFPCLIFRQFVFIFLAETSLRMLVMPVLTGCDRWEGLQIHPLHCDAMFCSHHNEPLKQTLPLWQKGLFFWLRTHLLLVFLSEAPSTDCLQTLILQRETACFSVAWFVSWRGKQDCQSGPYFHAASNSRNVSSDTSSSRFLVF